MNYLLGAFFELVQVTCIMQNNLFFFVECNKTTVCNWITSIKNPLQVHAMRYMPAFLLWFKILWDCEIIRDKLSWGYCFAPDECGSDLGCTDMGIAGHLWKCVMHLSASFDALSFESLENRTKTAWEILQVCKCSKMNKIQKLQCNHKTSSPPPLLNQQLNLTKRMFLEVTNSLWLYIGIWSGDPDRFLSQWLATEEVGVLSNSWCLLNYRLTFCTTSHESCMGSKFS